MNRAFNLLCRVLLLAVLLAACYIFGQFWWRNHCTMCQCQNQVTEELNRVIEELNQQMKMRSPEKLDPFSTIEFPQASRIWGVPQMFHIERPVFRTTEELGRKSIGNLTGDFDRFNGLLILDIEFTVGGYPRETHLEIQLQPVP